MAKSVLFLNVEQGPKSGHRLECKPSAIFTVGRTRANTLQISKDFGISQKHIYFCWSHDNPVGWTAVDAGSSNGTIINDVPIDADTPVALKDGDLIKIGAETTIRVEIPVVTEDQKVREAPKKKAAYVSRESQRKGSSRKPRGLIDEKPLGDCSIIREGEEYHDVLAAEQYQAKRQEETNCQGFQHETQHGISEADLSMTVEQWFEHMMEEGPKYLYRVSESIIDDIMQESRQFDEYVLSLE